MIIIVLWLLVRLFEQVSYPCPSPASGNCEECETGCLSAPFLNPCANKGVISSQHLVSKEQKETI